MWITIPAVETKNRKRNRTHPMDRENGEDDERSVKGLIT